MRTVSRMFAARSLFLLDRHHSAFNALQRRRPFIAARPRDSRTRRHARALGVLIRIKDRL